MTVFLPPSNATDLASQLRYINNLTDVGYGGVLGIIFLMIIGGPLFMMLRSQGVERAFGITSIIVVVCAAFLRIMSLINNTTLTVTIVLMAYGIYLLIKESSLYES